MNHFMHTVIVEEHFEASVSSVAVALNILQWYSVQGSWAHQHRAAFSFANTLSVCNLCPELHRCLCLN